MHSIRPSPRQLDVLRGEYSMDIRLLGIASSSRMLLSESGCDLAAWRDDFDSKVRHSPWQGRAGRGVDLCSRAPDASHAAQAAAGLVVTASAA